jgi:uncharacterized protein YbgA (DUF1722 family)
MFTCVISKLAAHLLQSITDRQYLASIYTHIAVLMRVLDVFHSSIASRKRRLGRSKEVIHKWKEEYNPNRPNAHCAISIPRNWHIGADDAWLLGDNLEL